MLRLKWQQLLLLLSLRWPAKRHPDREIGRMPSLSRAILHWLQLWWAVNTVRHLLLFGAFLLPATPHLLSGNLFPAPLTRSHRAKLPYEAYPLSCCLLN